MPHRTAQLPWHWLGKNGTLTTSRVLFYDSEFIREKSYYPQLALMQWQAAGERHAVLCDPLTMEVPWQALLERTAPLVVHSGSQDLELIYQESGRLPQSIRDTQIGFALCHPQLTVSLAEMVEYYLNEMPDKSAGRSDWLKRPLTREQLLYAANDAILLSRIYPFLCAELNQLGRMSWWAEECQHLLTQQKQENTGLAWYRLHHISRLKGREIAVAKLLHCVREKVAQERNCQRRQICTDTLILHIAQDNVYHTEELAEYFDSEHPIFTQQAALDAGFAAIREPYPSIPRPLRLTVAQRQHFDCLLERSREVAKALQIHSDLLTTQKNLRHYIAGGEHDCRIAQGWRAQYFEDLL